MKRGAVKLLAFLLFRSQILVKHNSKTESYIIYCFAVFSYLKFHHFVRTRLTHKMSIK